ncbi:hypothetical protein COV18_01180 [Candidatus Woesearchaeota archaeon CG10_big_fil_rev_8_21_14_0_10_37_12]|nr:MAG: hypothetical protein COV18_01180 [Candidatus Woesearchaeota archaeon CG10_big_fil_rev_8_21_14_0_10_37_12]
MIKSFLLNVYDKQYKKLLVFSFLVLFFCIGLLLVSYATTGEFIDKGVSLKGGLTLTVPVDKHFVMSDVEHQLAERFPSGDIAVREITEAGNPKALIIEAADVPSEEIQAFLPQLGIALREGEFTVENMGSALGNQFFSQTIKAVIFAFIAMAVVVFITFRSVVPSSFVILAAASDIICTLAVINLLGVRLSTAGIAAFLMLIGYSVDSDILLTSRVLKRKNEGGLLERILGAMKTGVTMTGTAIIAVFIGLVFTQSDTIRQIMLIVFIGLLFDLIFTWFQNAGILRWYIERKEAKHGQN